MLPGILIVCLYELLQVLVARKVRILSQLMAKSEEMFMTFKVC